MATDSFSQALSRLEEQVSRFSLRAAWISSSLREKSAFLVQDFYAAMSAREPSIRDAVSQSCLEWVKGNRFPMVGEESFLYHWDRFSAAYYFGRWLEKSGFNQTEKTEEQVLEWLLIDCWNNYLALHTRSIHETIREEEPPAEEPPPQDSRS